MRWCWSEGVLIECATGLPSPRPSPTGVRRTSANDTNHRQRERGRRAGACWGWGGVLHSCPIHVLQPSRRPMMRFAFSTISCPKWDFETIASRAREYGYEGVEIRGFLNESILTAANVFLTDPAKVRRT